MNAMSALHENVTRAVESFVEKAVLDKRQSGIVLNVSGGKDSTAMYLLAMERGVTFLPVFADTGNEHEVTLDYVRTLGERTGGPEVVTVMADLSGKFTARRASIAEKWPKQGVSDEVVKRAIEVCYPTGNPFLDSCILRAGFPSPKMRFCTDVLKITPIADHIYRPLIESGIGVESWQGVRREESIGRRDLDEKQTIRVGKMPKGVDDSIVVMRPLLDWTLRDVWLMHRRHGIEPNPLYAQGASRVGCMPCIMARKLELRVIAERHPEHINRIEEWERIVALASKREIPVATFFPQRAKKGEGEVTTATHGIKKQVQWAKTTRGGHQYDMMPIDPVLNDMMTSCGEWGACE